MEEKRKKESKNDEEEEDSYEALAAAAPSGTARNIGATVPTRASDRTSLQRLKQQ